MFHECAWGCRGQFVPARYNSSRAKCIKCHICGVFFSPNKFVFHSHRLAESDKYVQPDAANFNSWRRHTKLLGDPPEVRSIGKDDWGQCSWGKVKIFRICFCEKIGLNELCLFRKMRIAIFHMLVFSFTIYSLRFNWKCRVSQPKKVQVKWCFFANDLWQDQSISH